MRLRRALPEITPGLLLAVAVPAAAAAYHASGYRHAAIDDAFITFRYAENLATGKGLVYNPGEHVEGTSAFLFTVVLAFFRFFTVEPLLTARIVGVASYLSLVIGAFFFVRMVVKDRGWILGIGASILVAASTPLAFYSETGMETMLFAALLFLGAALVVREAAEERVARAWPLVMGAVALTRPEGVGYFLILLGITCARDVARGRAPALVRAAKRAGWFLLVYAPLLAFRLAYFHALTPNTVRAKANLVHTLLHASRAEAFSLVVHGKGALAVEAFLGGIGAAAFLLPAGLLLRRTHFATLVLLALSAGAAVVDVLDEGDWMPLSRLLTPAIGPLAVCMAFGLRGLLFHPEQRIGGSQWASVAIAITVFAATAKSAWTTEAFAPKFATYRAAMGKTLASLRRDDDLMVTDTAGMIPFYSKIRTVDLIGLCDAYIAEHGTPLGTMGKYDYDYVIRKRPTFYQFGFLEAAKLVYTNPIFREQGDEYWVVETPFFRREAANDKSILLVRKDRPGVEALAESMGGTLVDFGDELRKLDLL
jgi:arabinofuranosyltransferase